VSIGVHRWFPSGKRQRSCERSDPASFLQASAILHLWSQEDVANEAGLERDHYGRVERGEANISVANTAAAPPSYPAFPENTVVVTLLPGQSRG
jgi:hypothetical protein